MTYRKQLTTLNAEQSDIDEGTEFYSVTEVKDIIDNIESEVADIKSLLEEYKKWTLDELKDKLEEVNEKLIEFAKELY